MHGPTSDPDDAPAHEHHVHLSKANRERLAKLRRRAWQSLISAAVLAVIAGFMLPAIASNPELARSVPLSVTAFVAGVGAVGLAFVALLFWLGSRDLETSVTSYSSRPLGTRGTYVRVEPRLDDEPARSRHEHDQRDEKHHG